MKIYYNRMVKVSLCVAFALLFFIGCNKDDSAFESSSTTTNSTTTDNPDNQADSTSLEGVTDSVTVSQDSIVLDSLITSQLGSDSVADYTIMLYGTAGGDLDDALLFNLLQLEQMGYSESVRFKAQLKFSADVQQSYPQYEGTVSLEMDKDGSLTLEKIAESEFRMDNPDNLADFILETKTEMPANNYILIFWNHGNCFCIHDQPVSSSYETTTSKAVLYDDNNGSYLSIFEIEKALQLAGGVDMVYWDLCSMNTVEIVYQIKDYADYILGSAHVTPYFGGNYAQLVYSLSAYPNSLEQAVAHYIDYTVEYWRETQGSSNALDLTLLKTENLPRLVSAISSYRESLCSYRSSISTTAQLLYYQYYNGAYNQTLFYSGGGRLYYYPYTVYTVDIATSFSSLASYLLSGELSAKATIVDNYMSDLIVSGQSVGLNSFMSSTSIGVAWMSQSYYELDYNTTSGYGYQYGTMKELYPLLEFDKATGWSTFLSDNVMRNIGYENGYLYVVE